MAFDKHANRSGAERHCGGVEIRAAQHHAIGLFHVGHDVIDVWTAATRKAGESQRSAHQFQEIAAIHSVVPFRSMPREFPVEQIFEVRIAGQLFERAPVLFAGFIAQFLANGGEIQAMLLFYRGSFVTLMIVMSVVVIMSMSRFRCRRSLKDAQFIFV